MKKYNGLEAIIVKIDPKDQICTSGGNCRKSVSDDTTDNYTCVCEGGFQSYEYFNDQN